MEKTDIFTDLSCEKHKINESRDSDNDAEFREVLNINDCLVLNNHRFKEIIDNYPKIKEKISDLKIINYRMDKKYSKNFEFVPIYNPILQSSSLNHKYDNMELFWESKDFICIKPFSVIESVKVYADFIFIRLFPLYPDRERFGDTINIFFSSSVDEKIEFSYKKTPIENIISKISDKFSVSHKLVDILLQILHELRKYIK